MPARQGLEQDKEIFLETETLQVLDRQSLEGMVVIHRKAFPGSLLSRLGSRVVWNYYDWQMTGPHEIDSAGIFSHGELMAYCIGGVFQGAMSGFLRKNWIVLAVAVLRHPEVWFSVRNRGRLLRGLKLAVRQLRRPGQRLPENKPRANSYGILVIATAPEVRRKGYGGRLMEMMEKKARDKGFDRMHLTVDTGNLEAIGFYEKLGWEKDGGVSWEGRMIKPLCRSAG